MNEDFGAGAVYGRSAGPEDLECNYPEFLVIFLAQSTWNWSLIPSSAGQVDARLRRVIPAEYQMPERFADVIRKERQILNREREQLQKRLAELERELEAIDAYETATGKASASAQGRTRRAPARKTKRNQPHAATRQGGKRDALLQVLRENPEGLRRSEILVRMGVKGNKSGETSVSNALTALTKTHQLARQDGKYLPAQPE